MPTRSHPWRRLLVGLALALGPFIVLVALLTSRPDHDLTDRGSAPVPPPVHATDFRRQTVYHSPQRPGYTSWVGAWQMPDGSLMTGFVQATGPLDPAKRERTPKNVFALFGAPRQPPQRDFWGLDLSSKLLRSEDDGNTWSEDRSDRFKAVGPFGYTAQATTALKDGTIVRRVNGDDLRQVSSIPHTAFLQRLAPGARQWSNPQVLLDSSKQTYQLSRLRYLRDGRLIATGNVWDVPADTPLTERAKVPSRFLLMVSDNDGDTWHNGLTMPASTGPAAGLEWDTAELPSGRLVAMMRTIQDGQQGRKQGILEPRGDGFELTRVRPAPFPPSGHPELLATGEGPVLDIATTGVHYTRDGVRWRRLRFASGRRYLSKYYPRALQTKDGVVHLFGHAGADDPYGKVDQSIVMDSFRIARGR